MTNKIIILIIIFTISLIFCCDNIVKTDYKFDGYIYDASTDLPIKDVFVKVIGKDDLLQLSNLTTYSNEFGYFSFNGYTELKKDCFCGFSIDCQLSKDGYYDKMINPISEKYYLDPN